MTQGLYESLFHRMREGAAVHRVVLDDSGQPVDYVFLEANAAFERLTGLSRQHIIGRLATEIIPGLADDPASWIERYGQVAITGQEARFEQFSEALGRWYSVLAYRPEPLHFVTIFEEVSERRRATRRQRESERRLRTLMENLPGMAYRCRNEPGWPMAFVSSGARELTGYAASALEEGGGASYGELIHPDDRERVWSAVQAAIAEGEPFHLEYRIVTAQGEERSVWEKGQAVPASDGSVQALEGFIMDVTAQRQAQENFLRSQRLESVGRLAGGIAHDFNNMLSVIMTYAELIRMNEPDGDIAQDLDAISEAAERAQALTRQLLAFSRKQILEPVVLDISRTIGRMESLLRPLLGEDIDLRFALSEQLCPILADPAQLEQILMNLAVNARDAMPEGGRLTIETALVELGSDYVARHGVVEPGHYVMLAVSDTGHGMDAEVRAQIFDPFFTTKPVGQGTGLGLATVYGIVKQSGGYIWVYSELGMGTTFKIYLPCTAGPETVERTAAGGREQLDTERGGGTVLVVEDEQAILAALERGLVREGYQVHLARDGDEAHRMLDTHAGQLDFLLTDLVIPNGNGRSVAALARTTHPGIKILFMSGYTESSVAQQDILEEGAAFIQKPFTTSKVVRRLRSLARASSRPTGDTR